MSGVFCILRGDALATVRAISTISDLQTKSQIVAGRLSDVLSVSKQAKLAFYPAPGFALLDGYKRLQNGLGSRPSARSLAARQATSSNGVRRNSLSLRIVEPECLPHIDQFQPEFVAADTRMADDFLPIFLVKDEILAHAQPSIQLLRLPDVFFTGFPGRDFQHDLGRGFFPKLVNAAFVLGGTADDKHLGRDAVARVALDVVTHQIAGDINLWRSGEVGVQGFNQGMDQLAGLIGFSPGFTVGFRVVNRFQSVFLSCAHHLPHATVQHSISCGEAAKLWGDVAGEFRRMAEICYPRARMATVTQRMAEISIAMLSSRMYGNA